MRPVTLPEYDPERYLEYRANHRLALYIRAAIFVPSGIALTAVLVVALMQGAWVAVVVVGIGAVAVDSEAISTVRDLVSKPVTTQGKVGRSWKKARFLFLGSIHYIMVRGRLFEIGPVAAMELRPGDEIRAYHWPHTNAIITLERIAETKD